MKRQERGQAMVEFTMVLPLLLLLSFGTLEVGLHLQRRLVAGGASFVAARAAAVWGPRGRTVAQKVLATYAEDSRSAWLAESAGSAKVGQEGARLVRLQLARDGDAWTGVLVGAVELTGGSLAPQARWKADFPISQEFVPGGPVGKTYAREQTDLMVDYRATLPWQRDDLKLPFGDLFSKLPGGTNASMLLAANPAVQAALKNPQNRHGSTSPSKHYVGPRNEEYFHHTDKLGKGLVGLHKATHVAMGLYLLPPGTPGVPPGVQQALETYVRFFAEADRKLKFDVLADELERALNGFYGAGIKK